MGMVIPARERLDHDGDMGVGQRAEVVQVVYHGIQVHFENRVVRLFLQESGDVFKLEGACAFDEDDLVAEVLPLFLAQELFRVLVETGVRGKVLPVCVQLAADADEFGDTRLPEHPGHPGV